MASQAVASPISRPLSGVLFGITHNVDGSMIIRESKILKVGIGLPRGPAVNVWLSPDNKWKVRVGAKEGKTSTFDQRKDAEAFYRESLAKAPTCNYPRKIGFFTFTKPTIHDGAEVFEPDFAAIEAHGPAPTEIDIVFLDDEPFNGSYMMWSASELKCHGDGVTAMRVVTMATAEQRIAADVAVVAGEKYFPLAGCWTGGCPFAKEQNGKPSQCKPGGDLKFQLARNIRVGGTAYLHTTGYRSISQIFSSIYRLKQLTGGRLAGIPLKMVLRPYKTNHNGQAATQFGISLEFRAEDVESLRRNLIEQAWNFRRLTEPPAAVRMLEAGPEVAVGAEDDEPAELPVNAAAMAAEFYPEAVQDGDVADEPETPTPSAQAAAATQAKTETLSEKLRAKRTKPEPPVKVDAPPVSAQAGTPVNVPVTATPQPAAEMATEGTEDMF